MRSRSGWLAPLVALGLIAAACGDDDDGGDAASTAVEGGATATTGDAGGDGGDATTGATTGATSGGGAAMEGAELTIALGSEPTSLDPHLVDDGGERAINDNIYETLLTRTPDGELQPGLATELPTQVDDTTWEFTLREGVTFHGGEPFNAESVVATVERMIGLIERGETDNDGFYSTLTGAEAVDDTTVRIMTDGPDGVLPARMYWLKQIPASAAESPDMSDAPNGTGPYRFANRQQGVSIDLEANPDYWGDAPSITAVHYEFSDDAATRLAGLKSGNYDLITNLAPQDVEQAPAFAAVQGQEHPILILDADEGITADVDVRKALNLAVDKDAIADSLFGGYAAPDPGQLLSESILGFNPDLEPYPYDPDEATRLLEEAGAAGQTIELVGESGRWLKDRELLEAVAGYWTAVGLDVQLEILEFGAYLDVLFDRENRADAIYVSSSNDLLDPDRQLSTYYEAGGIGASNSDEELAGLIAAGRTELDPDARAESYREAVQLAYDQAYFVWIVNNQDIYGLAENVQWTPRVDSKLLVSEMSVTG
jgi:peptide/nickel transport system substrate-binding protein